MTDCERKTWLGQPACRFEARYDMAPAIRHFGGYQGPVEGIPLAIKASMNRTYVRDVCIRCGKTIERQR